MKTFMLMAAAGLALAGWGCESQAELRQRRTHYIWPQDAEMSRQGDEVERIPVLSPPKRTRGRPTSESREKLPRIPWQPVGSEER
ncbi:MAG: hypothetical protein ACLFV3_12895 [Phycisphaeraceae bacterium]